MIRVISSKTNIVLYEGNANYHGEYLKPSYLEIPSIVSPHLIDWGIGDYIVDEYTGNTFYLYDIPHPKRQATKDALPDSLVYSGVKLYAKSYDLTQMPFRDLVKYDDHMIFTSRADVTTYENIEGIVNRIQENADNFENGVWSFIVDSHIPYDVRSKEMNFSVTGNVIDALEEISNVWGIGWRYAGERDGLHTIIVGSLDVVDHGTWGKESYSFGKGNGLKSIMETTVDDSEYATRIYAYGSTRNLPSRYYNNIPEDFVNKEYADIPNLMIPFGRWGTRPISEGTVPGMSVGPRIADPSLAFIQDDETVDKNGLKSRTIYFDGSEQKEIYPTMEGVTYADLREVMSPTDPFYPKQMYPYRIDKMYGVQMSNIDQNIVYEDVSTLSIPERNRIYPKRGETEEHKIHIGSFLKQTQRNRVGTSDEIAFNIRLNSIAISDMISLSARLEFMTYTADKDDPDIVEKDGETYKVIRKWPGIVEPTSDGWYVHFLPWSFPTSPYSYIVSMVITTEISPVAMFVGSMDVVRASSPTINVGVYNLFKEARFTTRNLGFDLYEEAEKNSGKFGVIIKSGFCKDREFEARCERYGDTDFYIYIKPYLDTDTGTYFPSKDFPIAYDDNFVITNIQAPSSWIKVAEYKLYEAAKNVYDIITKDYLSLEIELDPIFMTTYGVRVQEGLYMYIEDEELGNNPGSSSEKYMIDSVVITRTSNEIPMYRVTLRNNKRKNLIDKLQEQVDKVSQAQQKESSVPEYASRAGVAEDSLKWGGHEYGSTFDQDLKTTDDVTFKSLKVENLEVTGKSGNNAGWLNARTYISQGQLYLVVPQGSIDSRCKIGVCRQVSNKSRKGNTIYKGWIDLFGLDILWNYHHTAYGEDYYLVEHLDYNELTNYEMARYNSREALRLPSLQRRCALVIRRDGMVITDKLHFTLVADIKIQRADNVWVPTKVRLARWE